MADGDRSGGESEVEASQDFQLSKRRWKKLETWSQGKASMEEDILETFEIFLPCDFLIGNDV